MRLQAILCFAAIATAPTLGKWPLQFFLKTCQGYIVPSWVIEWAPVFRLGLSPIQAVHYMWCTAWIGERPNLKTGAHSMTHDGTYVILTCFWWGTLWFQSLVVSVQTPNLSCCYDPLWSADNWTLWTPIVNPSERANVLNWKHVSFSNVETKLLAWFPHALLAVPGTTQSLCSRGWLERGLDNRSRAKYSCLGNVDSIRLSSDTRGPCPIRWK